MGSVVSEEIERFEEVESKGLSPLEKFFSMVEYLRVKGFKGEPRVFTNGPVKFFEAEMVKEEAKDFGKRVVTAILSGQEKSGEGNVKMIISEKFSFSIPYKGPFTRALADYLSRRMNIFKIRKKDRLVDEILERFERIDEVVG